MVITSRYETVQEITSDELTALAVHAKTDQQAFCELLRDFQPYIKSLAWRTSQSYELLDEAVQVLSIELWNAVLSFNEACGTPFLGFATHCLQRRYKSWFRMRFYTGKSMFHRTSARLDGPIGNIVRDTADDPVESIWKKELSEAVRAFMEHHLSSLERQVFSLWHANYSYQEICDFLGIEKKVVDNTLTRVKRKLKQSTTFQVYWAQVGS